ncbi:MAG: hypothetical protein PF508_17355, partial [Spirochaeta sp.]|nr:hypothetical protein [Spirochaeta sp.]
MNTLNVQSTDATVTVEFAGRQILHHAPDAPLLEIGDGTPSYRMSHGNFTITPGLRSRTPLRTCRVGSTDDAAARLELAPDDTSPPVIAITLSVDGNRVVATIETLSEA